MMNKSVNDDGINKSITQSRNEWMDGRMNESIIEWIMNGLIIQLIDPYMNEWLDGRVNQ